MLEADAQYLRELRELTEMRLREAIGAGREVALLDVPNQRNVGDSLIWAGEVAYFRRLGLKLAYAADIYSYDPEALRRAMPNGTVLLHGGGNFGDLWLGHQEHREQIVRDLVDYRIVQLSQSIYFQSKDRAAVSNEIIGAHPDFTLLIRDSLSMARAAEQLPDVAVEFCHDMALGWDAPAFHQGDEDTDRILVIARADKEQSSGLDHVAEDWIPGAKVDRTDWHNSGVEELLWRIARAAASVCHKVAGAQRRGVLPRFGSNGRIIWTALTAINSINIKGGVALYSPTRLVVVDRLHAHVLAVLLGIDHILLDNNYGKLRSIYDDYTGRFSTAHYATDIADARSIAEGLMER